MRIIIDGDGCPQNVKIICEKAADKFGIDMITVVDMAHYINSNYPVITVEQGRDAADYKIVEIFKYDDILVTQDYGLGSLLIKKALAVIHTNGFFISEKNIDTLLESRYIGQKIRKAGLRTKGPSKRTKEQDENFKVCLYKVIEQWILKSKESKELK